MSERNEKRIEVTQLADSDLQILRCPCCNSNDLKRSHSHQRTIPDLGTKEVRKFLEFESIHLQCKSCNKIFPFQRDGIIPGLSVSEAVLDTVLTLYYDFGNSAGMARRMMERLYSVILKDKTILKWTRKYGKEYCEKNNKEFKENIEHHSGIMSLDGTFPALELHKKGRPKIPEVKKKQGSCLQLTMLPNRTLLAIWDKAKPNRK
jgi:transposase